MKRNSFKYQGRQVNLVVDEYDGEILTNDEVNIGNLYRWRNTHDAMITKLRKIKTKKHLHDDDVDDIVDDDEETLTRAKFNSENEDANENEEENDDESRDKKEAIIDGSK